VPLSGLADARGRPLQRQDNRVHNPLPDATSDLEGYSDKAVRLQAAYKNGGFYGLFKVQGRDYKGTATTFRANIIKRGSNDLVDGFDPGYYPTDGYNVQTLRSQEVSARLRWELDGITLHSITAYDRAKYYSRGDVDGSRFGIGNGPIDGPSYPGQPALIPFDSQTADGTPTAPDHAGVPPAVDNSPLQWIAGVYYFNEKLQVDSFNFNSFATGDPQNGYAVQHQEAKSYAVFGNVNYALTPELKVRGGVRYTDDKDFDAPVRTWTPGKAPSVDIVGPFYPTPRPTTGAGTWAPTTAWTRPPACSPAWPPATAHRPSRAACCSATPSRKRVRKRCCRWRPAWGRPAGQHRPHQRHGVQATP
jgi:iron complex outermembrane receptor protein